MKFVLTSESNSVKRVALKILNQRGWNEYLHEVKHIYLTETHLETKAEAAYFCAQSGDIEIQNSISQEIFDTYPTLIQESILKGILKSDSMQQQQNAVEAITTLLKSEDQKKQFTALAILSQEYLQEFESEIFRLMA